MLDAYTLRKVIPRLAIAVIAINLSIYLCLAAVDITNVVGRGLGQLLTTPFITADSYNFGVGGSTITQSAAILGGTGIFVGAGGLGAVVGGLLTFAAAPVATIGMILLLMIPIALVALGVLITLVIRQTLVIFLVIISPVAIACFVFPGTEKYFRQWWNLFLRTLLVYPIIAAIFAMSDVMGSIVFRSATSGSGGVQIVKIITGIIVIYAPLFLIPLAFRLAGGVIGQVANVAAGGAKKVADLAPIKGRRDIARQDLKNRSVEHRSDISDKLKQAGSRNYGTGVRGVVGRQVANRALKFGAGAVGGYNIEAQASALRAAKSDELNKQIATGRDEEIRALTVNKQWALRGGETAAVARGDFRVENGQRQFRTLGGAWVSEANVDAGHSRWGDDSFAQQTALSYEMRKASTNDEMERIRTNYQGVAMGAGGWGLNQNLATGVLKGAGFENQQRSIEFKHMNLDGSIDYDAMAQDLYENRGNYALTQGNSHTLEVLRQAHQHGGAQTRAHVESIAETLMSRYGGGAPVQGMEGETPVTGPMAGMMPGVPGGTGQTQENYQVQAPGSGSVQEMARQLAVDVGVYRPLDPSGDIHSATGPSDNPRQH